MMSYQEYNPQSKINRQGNSERDQHIGIFDQGLADQTVHHHVQFQAPVAGNPPTTHSRLAGTHKRSDGTNITFINESDHDLMNYSFTDVVKYICGRTSEIDKIPDAFLTTVIDILFSAANVLSQEKPKIDKIISVLVDIGLKHRESGNKNKSKTNGIEPQHESSRVCKYNVESKCLSSLLQVYELEKKVTELARKRTEIISQALAECEQPVNLCNAESMQTDNVSDFSANCNQIRSVDQIFSSSAVNLAVNKIEKNIKEEPSDNLIIQPDQIKKEASTDFPFDYSAKNLTVAPLDHSSHTLMNDKLSILNSVVTNNRNVQNPMIENVCQPEYNVSKFEKNLPGLIDPPEGPVLDVIDMTNVVFEGQQNNVTSVKALKKICISACDDGSLHLFSLCTGECLEVIKLYTAPITSLCIWQTTVFSTSSDGQISSLVLPSKLNKFLCISEPISCSTEFSGLLYVGTTYGNIYKINVRSLTQIRCPIQVSSTCIRSIEVIRVNNGAAIIVVPERKPVTLRNPENGSLIYTFPRLDGCAILASLQSRPTLVCSLQQNLVSFISLKDSEGVQIRNERLSCNCICSSGRFFFLGGADGNIYVYDNVPGLICVIRGPGGSIQFLTVHEKKVILSCQGSAILAVSLPPSLISLMTSKGV